MIHLRLTLYDLAVLKLPPRYTIKTLRDQLIPTLPIPVHIRLSDYLTQLDVASDHADVFYIYLGGNFNTARSYNAVANESFCPIPLHTYGFFARSIMFCIQAMFVPCCHLLAAAVIRSVCQFFANSDGVSLLCLFAHIVTVSTAVILWTSSRLPTFVSRY